MSSLLHTIKMAGAQAVNASNPVSIRFGEVIKLSPLEVQVDQRFILTKEFLVLTEQLQEKKLLIEGKTYVIQEGIKIGDKLILLQMQGGQKFIVLGRGI